VGTVDPRAAVGRVWVQLSSPMQDSGSYLNELMLHFLEKLDIKLSLRFF